MEERITVTTNWHWELVKGRNVLFANNVPVVQVLNSGGWGYYIKYADRSIFGPKGGYFKKIETAKRHAEKKFSIHWEMEAKRQEDDK